MAERKTAKIEVQGGSRWVERLRLDHLRVRALLRLISGQLDKESFPVVERALITRDVMAYMHQHFDPAHHAIEGLLFRAVEGQDDTFDDQSAVLDDQHSQAFEEGERLLGSLDRAIADDDTEAYSEVLRQTAEYGDRMLVHLDYEEEHVFAKLEKLLQRLNPADLPMSVSDPLFDQQASDEYVALHRHSLYRVDQARQRRARAKDRAD